MRIVTNQGSNIHPSVVAEYDLVMAPQDIDVDGIRHDTRDGIDLREIERWVETATAHPMVLGSSASQIVKLLIEVAKADREILFITSSRKIIGTHDAVQNAVRSLLQDSRYADLDIRIVDTELADVGAGVPVMLAAEAARAGESLDHVEKRVTDFCRAGRMFVYVENLEGLVKGGRASFLKSWMANILRVRPILSFENAELCASARVSTGEDECRVLAERLAGELSCCRVWVGVAHGNDPARGQRLLSALGDVLDLEYVYALPISPSIYLHVSAGSIMAAVFPAPDDMGKPIDPARG